MKSDVEQLKSRGFLGDSDLDQYPMYSDEQLLALIKSNDAVERTLAARIMKNRKKKIFVNALCEQLKVEKKLYSKIEICNCLSEYGELAIDHLIPLIGTIGNNQHKKISNDDMNKKSYPLPRDIVARILCRMDPKVLTKIEPLLNNGSQEQILECIDLIGHVAWNNNNNFLWNRILELYNGNPNNEMIRWKCIRAMQSFNLEDIITILEYEQSHNKNEIFAKEAKRSLERINTK